MSYDGAPPPPPPQQPGPMSGPPYYAAPPPNHGSAVTALVLGILSVVLCGLFTGIPAMVMGRRVTREVRASGGALGGEGLGQAAFWTGLIGTFLSCFSGLLVVGVFAFGGTVSSSFEQTCTTVSTNGQGSSSSC
jgi:hypothetical protein